MGCIETSFRALCTVYYIQQSLVSVAMHYTNVANISLELHSWHITFWHIAILKQVTMPVGCCQLILKTTAVIAEGILVNVWTVLRVLNLPNSQLKLTWIHAKTDSPLWKPKIPFNHWFINS